MKLIKELNEEVDYLVEENEGKKNHYIQGVFLQSEITNRNGRMYPKSVLDREVKNYSEKYIKTNRALGELGHPEGPTVNLDRVSHKITELKEDGNNFVGKAKLLDTPMGNIAKNLLGEGVKLGVSSRGMGTLKRENGSSVVGEDFMLATAADIVSDPSAPDAFVEGIMEGKEWVWENGRLAEKDVAAIKHELDHATLINIQEKKISAFETFIKGL
tara:strand:- start:9587 stop:10231 length:645 start_codon:yes stop_codon:yes gene_type:complete